MNDLLNLLRDFYDLSQKYKVTRVEEEFVSPYFNTGGVSTYTSWLDHSPVPDQPRMTYGHERYVWKDSGEESDD